MRGHEIEDELTLSQAAAAAGVSRSTVRRMRERGELDARQDERGRWVVTVDALRAAGLSVGDQARERARELPSEQSADGEQAQSAVTLLDQLAPMIQQLTNLQRERGEIEGELRVAQFRLAQVQDRPSRAGTGLMVAAGALLTAAAGWALAPELHLLGAGLTAGAAVIAAGWAWVTR